MNGTINGRIVRAYDLAIPAGASATSTSPIDAEICSVRIVGSVDLWYAYGAYAQTLAVGAGTFLPAGFVEYLEVNRGEVFSAITDQGAAGKLNVSEITR